MYHNYFSFWLYPKLNPTHLRKSQSLSPNRFSQPNLKNFRTEFQEKFLTSRHVPMHRVIFYISNTLRKLMIRVWCLGECVGSE